jgi:hypothetical protein
MKNTIDTMDDERIDLKVELLDKEISTERKQEICKILFEKHKIPLVNLKTVACNNGELIELKDGKLQDVPGVFTERQQWSSKLTAKLKTMEGKTLEEMQQVFKGQTKTQITNACFRHRVKYAPCKMGAPLGNKNNMEWRLDPAKATKKEKIVSRFTLQEEDIETKINRAVYNAGIDRCLFMKWLHGFLGYHHPSLVTEKELPIVMKYIDDQKELLKKEAVNSLVIKKKPETHTIREDKMKEEIANFRGLEMGYIIEVYEGEGTPESIGRIVHYVYNKNMEQIGKIDNSQKLTK